MKESTNINIYFVTEGRYCKEDPWFQIGNPLETMPLALKYMRLRLKDLIKVSKRPDFTLKDAKPEVRTMKVSIKTVTKVEQAFYEKDI